MLAAITAKLSAIRGGVARNRAHLGVHPLSCVAVGLRGRQLLEPHSLVRETQEPKKCRPAAAPVASRPRGKHDVKTVNLAANIDRTSRFASLSLRHPLAPPLPTASVRGPLVSLIRSALSDARLPSLCPSSPR